MNGPFNVLVLFVLKTVLSVCNGGLPTTVVGCRFNEGFKMRTLPLHQYFLDMLSLITEGPDSL